MEEVKMMVCLFEDEEQGFFCVELDRNGFDSDEDFISACEQVAYEYFDDPHFIEILTPAEAENGGYDTY